MIRKSWFGTALGVVGKDTGRRYLIFDEAIRGEGLLIILKG